MSLVNFYIDGYNLYYALKDSGLYHLLWLDFEKFCKSFLISNLQDIGCIYFFTAIWKRKPESEKRQHLYLDAARAASSSAIIIKRGKFIEREVTCDYCRITFIRQKEKQTDINIAIQMILDAINGNYDIAYLLTSDSDYVPLIQLLRQKYEKDVRVLFPPGQFSKDLDKAASECQPITPGLLISCQLPDTFVGKDGKTYKKPLKWMQGRIELN